METPKSVLRGELIGLHCEVISSTSRTLVGINGKIVDESQNTIVIKTKDGLKRVLKKGSVFMVDKKYKIKGEKIHKRPHERIMLR